MREKIEAALLVVGMMVPKGVRQALLDLGTEVDRLRAEADRLIAEVAELKRSNSNDGK